MNKDKNYLIKRSLVSFFQILILFSLLSCSVPDFAKPAKTTVDPSLSAKEQARKNVDEGRGVNLKDMIGGGNSNTNYEFSTSNPLWRASLSTIDFMPLTTVDYSGGIIITDWYSDSQNLGESIKITVRFLSNEVRSDSIKIIVHSKQCVSTDNCEISEIDSQIKFELTETILSKAALLEKESKTSKK